MNEALSTPSVKNRAPAMTAGMLAVGIFVFTALNSQHPSMSAAGYVFGISLALGLVIWLLLRVDAIPGALLAGLIAFAYVPSSWDAISVGFARTDFHVTFEGLKLALVAFPAQIAVTALGAWWGAKTPILASLVHPDQALFRPDKSERSFVAAFILFLLATWIASIIDGQWTYYAPGGNHFDEMSRAGGFRLSLLYCYALLGAAGLCGLKLASVETRSELWAWVGFTGFVLLLVFLFQGRRFMLAGVALMVLPQLSHRGGIISDGSTWRSIVALGFATAVLSGLFYGSLVWRTALRRHSEDALSHLSSMTEIEVGADEAVENVRDRLTYLWMDAVALEFGDRGGDTDLLTRSFGSTVAANIPGALYPEKYKWEPVTCENLFASTSNKVNDLPCTAIAEGVLFGGTVGAVSVALCWALAIGLCASFYAAGTASGKVLSGAMLGSLITIETSAFPILSCLRTLVLFVGFLIPLTWLYHSVESLWLKTHPDVLAGLDEETRAKRRARLRASMAQPVPPPESP